MIVFARQLNTYSSLEEFYTSITPTPLVRLDVYGNVWAKLEFFNRLSRSIKDRVAVYMIWRLRERLGDLRGVTIEEASSGNFALALAVLSRIYGFRLRAYTPRTSSRVFEVLLKALGAEVVRLNHDVLDERVRKAVYENAAKSGSITLNQFENPLNPEGHYRITGDELVMQFRAIGVKPDVLIAGIGTGGHITGIASRLREEFGKIRVIGVVPRKGAHIHGLKRIEDGVKWIEGVIDEIVEIDDDEAIEGVIQLARDTGLLVGLSSGAVFKAFLKVRGKHDDAVYALIFPDDVFKYADLLEKRLLGLSMPESK